MLCNRHEVALLYILSTCYYLNELVFADIYLSYPHMVGIGVTLYLLYLSHNYI